MTHPTSPPPPPTDAVWAGADGVARRTHPLTLVAAALSIISGVVLAVIFEAASLAASRATTTQSPGPPFLLALLFVLVPVVGGVVQILQWFVRTYTVLPTELVIDEGLLTREHRVLPFARVQQADTHQSLIGQLIGVTELRIDCAGATGQTEVKLRLLDDRTALALRDYVLKRRHELQLATAAHPPSMPARPAMPSTDATPAVGTAAPPVGIPLATTGAPSSAAEPPEVEVVQLGPTRLALGAITHTIVLGMVPALLVVGLWVGAFLLASGQSQAVGVGVGILVAVPGVAFLFLFIAVSIVFGSIVGQWGFRVSVAGDDVHLRFGLLQTRNLTVPRRRVQQITVADNLIRRPLGLVELHLHTAAGVGAHAGTTTRFLIPVLRRDEVDEVVTRLMGDHRWAIPELTPRNHAARRRAMVRRSALMLLVVSGPTVVLWPAGLVLVPLAIAAGIGWGRAAHRRAGHGTSTTVVALSHGAFHHRIDVVPLERIQSCRTTSNPFQRRAGVETFWIDVAGSLLAPFLWDMATTTGDELRRALPRAAGPNEHHPAPA